MSISSSRPADTPAIEQTCWRIDPARSSVEFHTPTLWGLTTVKGRFERYSGTLDLQETPAVQLTIDAASVNTKNGLRDKHLRSEEFFEVRHHPEVVFVSESATLDGEHLKVRGRLSAAGSGMTLDLEARLRRVGDELEVEADAYADQQELGMSRGTLGMIRKPSKLLVRGRLVRDVG